MRSKLALGVALVLALGAGTGAAQPPVPIAFIKVADVQRLLKAGKPVVLIDVRSREEYLARHIKGAVSIPLPAIEERSREVPRRGLVVLY